MSLIKMKRPYHVDDSYFARSVHAQHAFPIVHKAAQFSRWEHMSGTNTTNLDSLHEGLAHPPWTRIKGHSHEDIMKWHDVQMLCARRLVLSSR